MTTPEDITMITQAADSLAQRLARVRRCPKCATTKPITAFTPTPSHPSGVHGYCRDCHREVVRAYRATDIGREANRRSSRESHARARAKSRTSRGTASAA